MRRGKGEKEDGRRYKTNGTWESFMCLCGPVESQGKQTRER